jgi:hypothetical protein
MVDRYRRSRTVFGALSTALLAGWASTAPQTSSAVVEAPAEVAAEGDPLGPPTTAETSENALAEAETVDRAAPLHGLTGAATALTVGDVQLALDLLDAEPAPPAGSDDALTFAVLRGRAYRILGDGERSVSQLAPLMERRDIAKRFPKDVLGTELARARLLWATVLPAPQADEQRSKAAAELEKLERLSPLRHLPTIKVLRAEALAGVMGSSAKSTKAAATRAYKELDDILRAYPRHPRVGDLWLAKGRALQRAGKHKEAAVVYRAIGLERPGEPEADEAWQALEALAASDSKVSAKPWSLAENLQRAENARGLRRVELSRELLDAIIDDPSTPKHRVDQALRSRSWTAYKQRDFARCADDLRPMFADSGNIEIRSQLLRCLERGEMYEEALEIILAKSESGSKGLKAAAVWDGAMLAFRGGLYDKVGELLERYAKISRGHVTERYWLDAWLAYRQGDEPDAIEKFKLAETKTRTNDTRARYFRGKLMLRSKDAAQQTEGETLLRQLAASDALGYYGIQARRRLREAGKPEGKALKLTPVADEATPLSREDATTKFAELDAKHGAAWPSLRRAHQLYRGGYTEEARRELRIADLEYLKGRYGFESNARSEAVIEGLGWKSEWKVPHVNPTRAGRKSLRDKTAAEELAEGLRVLSLALDEPFGWAKLCDADDGSFKARWHPRAFRGAIEREAKLRNVDPLHLWSLMYTESRFRRHVVSPVGARGALQIMPWTGRQLAERLGELNNGRFDADTLFDIDTNAHLASYYIAELLAKFQGQAPMAYASYNGGPSNVARWLRAKAKSKGKLELDGFLEEIAFTESNRYAKRVVEVHAAYSLMYRGVLPELSNDVDPTILDNIDF